MKGKDFGTKMRHLFYLSSSTKRDTIKREGEHLAENRLVPRVNSIFLVFTVSKTSRKTN